ncbi:peroxiredoxin [Epidermidibacterium keratini]|uniref:peroxiredoxin n=1 Tax=Epidermidibacterium keratini TaxID=1891644 RepID=UPI001CEF79C2|nr:peroxiredoxin [Epidermidibacterium keratini]
MAEIKVGDQAPEFATKDQNNQDVSLADFRGKQAVLLVFYPFAFSGICTGELCAVRDDISAFQNDDVQVLPISVDHPFALKAWAQQEGYEFPLLSDFWPHGQIAEQYGVFEPQKGFALRGTFLIDRDGIVRFAEVNGPGEARDQSAWRDAMSALAA